MAPITHQLHAFFGGLHRRIPGGHGDDAVAARGAIARSLAELNAHMLGREVDHRVPVDIEAMAAQIMERMDRYTSADWDRGRPSTLDVAHATMTEIARYLRPGGASTLDDEGADDEE